MHLFRLVTRLESMKMLNVTSLVSDSFHPLHREQDVQDTGGIGTVLA